MSLALHGGDKSVSTSPKVFEWILPSEYDQILDLVSTQKLSGFLAQTGKSYLGGEHVLRLEEISSTFSDGAFAVSFNSWTSGLEAIFTALDFEQGSEIIVPPWTMSATVAAIVLAGYSPVFCDIDFYTFNLDPARVRELVNTRTRAICAVDIFGLPANWPELRRIADEFNLKLIADSAQSPSARIEGRLPISFADAGGFSLNRHKHIQSGEGGIAVTYDADLRDRLQAIRNHGEVAAPEITLKNRILIGHNWRLGEFEALVAGLQYKRLEALVYSRRNAAKKLIEGLGTFEGLTIPDVAENSTHDYYILGMHFNSKIAGFTRDYVVDALRAEGIDFVIGEYCELQKLSAYANFAAGDLPITELLNRSKFLGLYLCGYQFDESLISEVITAFKKVWDYSIKTEK